MNSSTKLTPHQAKYFASVLTRKTASNDQEKLMSIIMDAQVEPKPHQIEAANFAFRSPFSKGAILADEVGLGKTIEAGIVLSQYWAEGKNNLLIVAPANLRQQWSQELREKFFLDSVILDSKRVQRAIDEEKFIFKEKKIYICSYDFIRRYTVQILTNKWDLVVIDEAHRLRNVYKKDSTTAQIIKKTFTDIPKLLLTATPLQNSLLELYGLVSIIDSNFFGSLESFKDEYVHSLGTGKSATKKLNQLQKRFTPLVTRNLRQNVQEYINYTQRHSHTQEFESTPEEIKLYQLVTEYLSREKLFAFAKGQRHLVTLLMLKLLGSSSYALSQTLDKLASRLKVEIESGVRRDQKGQKYFDQDLLDAIDEDGEIIENLSENEYENLIPLSEYEIGQMKQEVVDLSEMAELASSITEESKAKALLQAIQTGFGELKKIGAQEKTIIFTESTRTQEYLLKFLSENGYEDQIVTFNGSGGGEKEKQIYLEWLEKNQNTDKISGVRTADKRKSIVDYFKDTAKIMIATEAAGEGINLQFCSMMVNYDLPWNPQRVEQRIGRIHRYGQKFDVIVFNFLNLSNAAERRILELLTDKFQLFDGVFGASDQILGAIESGFDFEKNIAEIIKTCRTREQIESSFNKLQDELSEKISQQMSVAKRTLFDNFDSEVAEKLRVSRDNSNFYLSKSRERLWKITYSYLADVAVFNHDDYKFKLNTQVNEHIPLAKYSLQPDEESINYRFQHPLAQKVLKDSKRQNVAPALIEFNYSQGNLNITRLKPLIGKEGQLFLYRYALESKVENQEYYIFIWQDSEGNLLDDDLADKLLDLPAKVIKQLDDSPKADTKILNKITAQKKKEIEKRNHEYLREESEKVENWADDVMKTARLKIKKIDQEIKNLRAEARLAQDVETEFTIRQKIKKLTNRQFDEEDAFRQKRKEINEKTDEILDTIKSQLKSQEVIEEVFAINWKLV